MQFVSDLVGILGGYFLYRLADSRGDWLFAGFLALSLISLTAETGVLVRAIQAIFLFLGTIGYWATSPDPGGMNFAWLVIASSLVLMVVNGAQVIGKIAGWVKSISENIAKAINSLRSINPQK